MTIIQRSLSILREISVGDNQPSVRFASPETPGINNDGQNWQRRGYLGDYPLDRGGMSPSNEQWQPWFVIADPETGNPERETILYQVRRPRGILRRSSDKTFILGGFGNSETYFIGHHQLQGYVEEPSLPGDFETAVSGGYYMKKRSEYVLHGYPGPRLYPSAATFSTYDGGGFVMQYRCVPANPATDGYPWATQTAQFNCGIDNYIGGDAKENGHSRFTKITNRWQVGIMGGVQHPSMTQPPGIGYADFLNSVFPWDTAFPDEEIWLERGAYDSGPDTQQLVLKRSAPLSSTKVYTLTKLKGEFSATPATVTMAAGSSSVQFEVTVPASPTTAQQVLYITDGSTEDHWGDFIIGNGSSTGDTGGGTPGNPTGDYSRTNLLLESDDVRETPEWDLQSGSSNAPDGGGWQTITNGTGEIRQEVAGFTAGEPSTFSVELDPDSTDWVLLRISDDTYAVGGCHQFVNVTTGALGVGTTYGAATNLSCVVVAPIPGGSGGVQAKLTVTLPSTSRIAMARAASGDHVWDQEPGLTFQARYWQFQSGSNGTNHIPTNATAVTRTLTTATITGTASTPVAPALTGTLTLIDNASQPWDQFSDITITSSSPSVVSVTQATGETNYLGAVTFQYTPLANGSANITAVAGDVTSNTFAVTVSGTAVTIDAPAAPVVTVSNSDTVAISVGSIDSDATHVAIEAKLLNPDEGGQLPVFAEVANLAKASLPVTVTGLTPGKQYRFRARSYAGSTFSAYSSESALVTLKRLMVEGYVSTRALNQTDIQVQVFRPPTGLWDALPLGESLGYWTGQVFGGVAVVVTGQSGPIEQAPIRVVMTRHPTTGKIRHGDRLMMIAVLDDPRTVSQPISNAKVIEDV